MYRFYNILASKSSATIGKTFYVHKLLRNEMKTEHSVQTMNDGEGLKKLKSKPFGILAASNMVIPRPFNLARYIIQ